jgi:hypothetical protein
MSENVELVRSIFADWERGDFSRSDWADPQIEYVIADGPGFVGRTGIAEMAEEEREFLRTFEHFSIAAEGYREVDDARVLVLHHGRQNQRAGLRPDRDERSHPVQRP